MIQAIFIFAYHLSLHHMKAMVLLQGYHSVQQRQLLAVSHLRHGLAKFPQYSSVLGQFAVLVSQKLLLLIGIQWIQLH